MIPQHLRSLGLRLFPAVVWLVVGGTLACPVAADDGDRPPQRPKRQPHVGLVRDVLQEKPSEADPHVDPEQAAAEAAAKAEIQQSDAMLQARAWLDGYFAVQMDYSEQEVIQFKQRLDKMSSMQLRWFLVRYEQQRALLGQRREASEHLRAQSVTMNRLAAQRQQTARKAAAGAHRYGHPGGYSYPKPRAKVRHRGTIRPPLISSLSMARYYVYRAAFGGYW